MLEWLEAGWASSVLWNKSWYRSIKLYFPKVSKNFHLGSPLVFAKLGVLNTYRKSIGEPLAYVDHFRDVWPEIICDWFMLGICIQKKNTAIVGKYFIQIFGGKEKRELKLWFKKTFTCFSHLINLLCIVWIPTLCNVPSGKTNTRKSRG